jgi:dipeptidyl aminopeptidase/acylaminoacyl peptidase
MIGRGLALVAVVLSVAVSARAAPPVEAYGRLPAVERVRMSPSGDRIAFVATDGDKKRVTINATDGSISKSVDVGRIKVRDLEWAGDDHLLIALSGTSMMGHAFSNAEVYTVDVVDLSTGKTFQVFHEFTEKMLGAVFGSFGTRQVDGHWYGWFAGLGCDPVRGSGCVTYHDHLDLYRVDLDNGSIQIAAQGHKDSDGWLVSATGEIAARSFYAEKDAEWTIASGASGDQVVAGGKNDLGGAGDLSYGRTAETMLVETPVDGEKGTYAFRELSLTGAPEQALADGQRIAEVLIDPTSHLWIGSTMLGDDQETIFFSPTLEARWRGTQKAFPNYISRLAAWNADFNRLIVMTEGADDSGTYWLVDIQKHSADPIGYAYPDVKQADVGPVSMVTWKASDGMDLHGVLTLPPGGKPAKGLPFVVLPHGGPEARDYPGFDWWAQAFASQGYAVFQPNFRGSAGYGVQFRNAGFGQWGRKMQTDISDGVADLVAKGIVDPKRACIIGGSYGGYAALAGVTVQHGLYRCAVSVAGVADPADMLTKASTDAGYRSPATHYWQAFMGVTQWQGGQLDPISPAALAAKADAPILLIHGKDDSVVPYSQSVTMASALKSAGKPVEFVTMDNEDHWLSQAATRTEMLKAAVAFVEKHNPSN